VGQKVHRCRHPTHHTPKAAGFLLQVLVLLLLLLLVPLVPLPVPL
jgi:hypothetical protein